MEALPWLRGPEVGCGGGFCGLGEQGGSPKSRCIGAGLFFSVATTKRVSFMYELPRSLTYLTTDRRVHSTPLGKV